MLFLLLVIAPLGTGLLMNRFVEVEKRSIGLVYISGFLILLAMFQLIAVPVVFLDAWGFDIIVSLFTIVMTLFTGFGIVQALHLWRREGKVLNKKTKERSKMKKLSKVLVLVLAEAARQ